MKGLRPKGGGMSQCLFLADGVFGEHSAVRRRFLTWTLYRVTQSERINNVESKTSARPNTYTACDVCRLGFLTTVPRLFSVRSMKRTGSAQDNTRRVGVRRRANTLDDSTHADLLLRFGPSPGRCARAQGQGRGWEAAHTTIPHSPKIVRITIWCALKTGTYNIY